MLELFLVSCVSRKQQQESAARDLYTSAWFLKARAWVEQQGSPWYILSAEHGLVHPATQIAPYERALNKMRVSDRREWASRVDRQMEALGIRADRVVVLAGQAYRSCLLPYLQKRAAEVVVPMEGLGIGQQLAWLKKRI